MQADCRGNMGFLQSRISEFSSLEGLRGGSAFPHYAKFKTHHPPPLNRTYRMKRNRPSETEKPFASTALLGRLLLAAQPAGILSSNNDYCSSLSQHCQRPFAEEGA